MSLDTNLYNQLSVNEFVESVAGSFLVSVSNQLDLANHTVSKWRANEGMLLLKCILHQHYNCFLKLICICKQ